MIDHQSRRRLSVKCDRHHLMNPERDDLSALGQMDNVGPTMQNWRQYATLPASRTATPMRDIAVNASNLSTIGRFIVFKAGNNLPHFLT
jgi:hypothetical protein